MKIKFYGAARTVTGSKHLLTTKGGDSILLDCGFFQGRGQDSDVMNREFSFDPKSLTYLILSHAHIDHSGNIPNLVKEGFRGKIFATPATIDLCRIMLKDSAHIQENDLKHVNKRRLKRGEDLLEPLYDVQDVEEALKLFVPVKYDHKIEISEEVSLLFTDSGHILGSAAVNLEVKEGEIIKKICFTGDIGRYNSAILKDPQVFPQCDVLISESTYGDRLHSDNDLSSKELLEVIRYTCVEKKGKLIIPAFSLGRTQEIVYALDKMESQGILPHIKVFVDSPLSINATDVMRAHPECFNESMLEYMKTDSDPFGFQKLHYIQEVEVSKKLNSLKEPCIIISASGMIEAGRIKHHVANNISDSKNTILIVGYAEPSSIGGKIRSGSQVVKIFGEEFKVNADVVILDSYSAHADYEEMFTYFECQDISKIKKVFLVHGEYETQLNFKEKMLDKGFRNIVIPAMKDEFEI
jgi:metallo-beta-lactamase family protein